MFDIERARDSEARIAIAIEIDRIRSIIGHWLLFALTEIPFPKEFSRQVTIFNPHDYPDMTSGGVIEIFVPTETQMNIELQGIVSYGTKNILRYSLKHRHCVFPEEMILAHATYTYSDCIVDCRIQNIWEICRCIPFYMPNRGEIHHRAKIPRPSNSYNSFLGSEFEYRYLFQPIRFHRATKLHARTVYVLNYTRVCYSSATRYQPVRTPFSTFD